MSEDKAQYETDHQNAIELQSLVVETEELLKVKLREVQVLLMKLRAEKHGENYKVED